MNWRFRALASAYAISSYGNYLNLIALSLFSYQVTGTAFGVGAVMALRLFSGLLAGLAAGALSARATRRTVMICTDLAQAGAMTTLALFAAHTPLWLLGAAVMVLGAGNTFFTVALRSAVPVLVGHEARAGANGLLVTARSLATVLGFASAAPVIAMGGYATAFAVNAASFAVSAAVVVVLRPRTDTTHGTAPAAPAAPVPPGPSGGLRLLRHAASGTSALVLGMVLLRGLDALASSSHNVALPVVAHSVSPGEPAAFMTRFWVAWAVGTLLAHLVLKRRKGEGAWSERAFALGTCAMSLAFIAAFTGLPTFLLVVAAGAAGLADGWTEIVYVSRLQAAPEAQRARLFGLSATAETTGFAVGTVAAAAALDVLPALSVVGAFHGTAVCGALVLLLAALRRADGRPRPLSEHSRPSGGR